MTEATLTDLRHIPFQTADGGTATLSDYADKVLLIVNVASKCGLTPQYEQLEKLQRAYADRGFTVLGFPCNQFGGQEPGLDGGDPRLLLDDVGRHASPSSTRST